MSSAAEHTELEPFFLEGSAGRLFCVYHGPKGGKAPEVGILLVPPFAEELNKVRRQLALQVRAFAAQGYGVLVMDLFGTGDSEGDFSDARWGIWCDDLRRGADWLHRRHLNNLVLWGVRSGALLATDILASLSRPVSLLLLWQPVATGQGYMNQFLRLRVAADMLEGVQQVTTREMLAQLEQGVSLEVAGYELHPELAMALLNRDLDRVDAALLPGVCWLEMVAEDGRPLLPASRRVIEGWQAAGVTVASDTTVGEPFWSTPEISVAPALIERSCRCVSDMVP